MQEAVRLGYDKTMIAQLTGKIAFKHDRFVVLDVAGVGYKVFASGETLKELKKTDQIVSLWTHLVVREDALDLYGFRDRTELDFFVLLIAISGVGPKSALSILSLAPPETLRQAVTSGNTAYLTQVSGIGKKIAEKIVLELRDKINHLTGGDSLAGDQEVIMAMEALGYSAREAREALRSIPAEITGTEAKIKEALKKLN